jgi:hypothetical protein
VTLTTRSILFVLLALLAALVQGGGAVHAAAYGPGPHEHDGVVCALAVQGEREDEALPPSPVPVPLPSALSWRDEALPEARAVLASPIRAPPARAPPLRIETNA